MRSSVGSFVSAVSSSKENSSTCCCDGSMSFPWLVATACKKLSLHSSQETSGMSGAPQLQWVRSSVYTMPNGQSAWLSAVLALCVQLRSTQARIAGITLWKRWARNGRKEMPSAFLVPDIKSSQASSWTGLRSDSRVIPCRLCGFTCPAGMNKERRRLAVGLDSRRW
ncbi:hypothetical protein D3C81_1596230 [compost metagenome]